MTSLNSNDFIAVYVDIDAYKDISFPDIVIKVLVVIFEQLRHSTNKRLPFYKHPFKWFKKEKFLEKIDKFIKDLNKLLDLPDVEQKQIRTKVSEGRSQNDSLSLGLPNAGIKITDGQNFGTEEETQRTVPFDKLNSLKKKIVDFQGVFHESSSLCSGAPIYLILDDFYFIPKNTQPDFIDYFHRLTKGTPLFLKVATIKHRSNLYKSGESFIGVELNHDIYPIDLDYTLDRLEDLERFMESLLKRAVEDSESKISIEELFTANGFKQLCLASGGVPRDFLSLFVNLLNKLGKNEANGKIDKVHVTEAAIASIQGKSNSLNVDSADDQLLLEEYLNKVKDLIYQTHRTNIFLASKDDLEQFKQARQAIRELVDLRFLHLVESNTSSAPSDGKFYEAYMIDIGLYDNSRPRNFNQIEPGIVDEKQRKDSIRACPKISLKQLESDISRVFEQQRLVLTE